MLLRETNLTRPLTARLEDGTVVNHRLITVIRFVVKSYIHLLKNFVNRFHLDLHAESRRWVLDYFLGNQTRQVQRIDSARNLLVQYLARIVLVHHHQEERPGREPLRPAVNEWN